MVADATSDAQMRPQLLQQMAAEFSLDVAKAIVRAVSEETGLSCERTAQMMIDAWKGSKERSLEDIERDADCFEKIVMYP